MTIYGVITGAMVEQIAVPTCTNVGQWEELQCSGQATPDGTPGACWCVDRETGEPTTGSMAHLPSCTGCISHQMRMAHSGIRVGSVHGYHGNNTSCDQ